MLTAQSKIIFDIRERRERAMKNLLPGKRKEQDTQKPLTKALPGRHEQSWGNGYARKNMRMEYGTRKSRPKASPGPCIRPKEDLFCDQGFSRPQAFLKIPYTHAPAPLCNLKTGRMRFLKRSGSAAKGLILLP
jgi:hypothetical protein